MDGHIFEAKPGAFVNVPPNVLHSFKNETNETAKIIILLSPPRNGHLFVEVGLKSSNNSVRPPLFSDAQKQKLSRLASKYGMEIRP